MSSSLTSRRYVFEAALPLIEPADPLAEPLAVPAEPLVEPDADVLGEVDGVEPVVPDVDEPVLLAAPCEALVRVQLSSDPCRQPVTVTVLALALGLVACSPLVPVAPLVLSCESLVELGESLVVSCAPLCAATLTAKAHAMATHDAVPNTRFMCPSSWL